MNEQPVIRVVTYLFDEYQHRDTGHNGRTAKQESGSSVRIFSKEHFVRENRDPDMRFSQIPANHGSKNRTNRISGGMP